MDSGLAGGALMLPRGLCGKLGGCLSALDGHAQACRRAAFVYETIARNACWVGP